MRVWNILKICVGFICILGGASLFDVDEGQFWSEIESQGIYALLLVVAGLMLVLNIEEEDLVGKTSYVEREQQPRSHVPDDFPFDPNEFSDR